MRKNDRPGHLQTLLCASLVWLAVSGPVPFCPPTLHAEVVERIVAIVNDDILMLSELNAAFAPYAKKIKEMQQPLDRERRMLFQTRMDVLNQMIDQKLTDQEIKRRQIDVSEPEIDAALARFKESRFLSEDEFLAALRDQGMTLEGYRNELRGQILRTRLVNAEIKSKVVITEEEIRKYYDQNLAAFGGGKRYHLFHILKWVPEGADPRERDEIRAVMEEARRQLASGAAFDELVARYSDEQFRTDGGDLGVLELSSLAPMLRSEVENLAAGGFTPVMETDQGFQILMVSEVVVMKGKPLEEVSSQIESRLYENHAKQRFERWLEDLRKQAHIKIIN